MPYHINDKGDVRRCAARLHCPYGDFETQHYTTEAEGRLAYEAAKEGKTFKPGLKAILEAKEEGSKDLNKLKKKAASYLQEAGTQDVHVQKGHIVREDVLDFKSGDLWVDGSYFYMAENVSANEVIVYHGEQVAEGRWGEGPQEYDWRRLAGTPAANKYRVRVTDEGKPAPEQWSEDVDPELLAAARVSAKERTMAASEEVIMESMERTFLRSSGTDIAGYYSYSTEAEGDGFYKWSPRTILTSMAREYRSLAKDAERSGIANPHTFALAEMKKRVGNPLPSRGYPHLELENGRALALGVMERVLLQDDEFEPDSHERRIILRSWPEGRRPWLDYLPSELRLTSSVVEIQD